MISRFTLLWLGGLSLQEVLSMTRWITFGVVSFFLFSGVLFAQDEPQRGTIKSVSADKSTLTITADGKDLVFKLTANIKVVDTNGKQIADPFHEKAFKIGTAVLFKANGDTLIGIRVGVGVAGSGKQPGPGEIKLAKIAKIDFERMTITLKTPDKDLERLMTEETQVLGALGKDLREKLQGFEAGADVNYVARKKDVKDFLFGIRLLDGKGGGWSTVRQGRFLQALAVERTWRKGIQGRLQGRFLR
jgi:hypothetical protein